MGGGLFGGSVCLWQTASRPFYPSRGTWKVSGISLKKQWTDSFFVREKPKGEKIINSPHKTDAEYVRKGNQKVTGHKGFVSETCDEENKTQFITDVNGKTIISSEGNGKEREEQEIIEIGRASCRERV